MDTKRIAASGLAIMAIASIPDGKRRSTGHSGSKRKKKSSKRPHKMFGKNKRGK